MKQLADYENINLIESISSFVVKKAKSKEGTEYFYLDLTFCNGFSKRIFINQSDSFGFLNAFDQLEV